jgi:hypothetical protein
MDHFFPRMLVLGVLCGTTLGTACSGGGLSVGRGTGGRGAGGALSGTAPGSGVVGAGAGGATIVVGAGAGGSTSGAGGATTSTGGGGTSGDAAASWPNVGVCGERGQATADETSYDGSEERYIVGEEGFGNDVCVVRFDVKRVGDAPHASGCKDPNGPKACDWTHLLEYSNPRVLTNTDGVCAKSDTALTAGAIAKIAGTRVEIGFAKQLTGFIASSRLKYSESTGAWELAGLASWGATTKAFSFSDRSGYCNYGP